MSNLGIARASSGPAPAIRAALAAVATTVAIMGGLALADEELFARAPAARPATMRVAALAGSTTTPSTRPTVTPPPQPALPPPSVILYGDSLATESQDVFRGVLNDAGIADVRTQTFGGTALCDWLDRMRADAAETHPTAVVIEFSGNALTPCMQDSAGNALTGDAYYAKYAADATEALRIFLESGARVYFASAPINQHAADAHDPNANRLNAMYASLANFDLSTFEDAGASVLDHDQWTKTLPCLPNEPCTGGTDANGTAVNIVRAPDGGHFCPTAPAAVHGVTGICPVWSSGAYRYGNALASAVIHDTHPSA
jgi:hypothetical protein